MTQIFVRSFLIRLSALTLAGSVVLYFALLAEGVSCTSASFLVEILPFSAIGAAAWSITEWKRHGGDIAWASGGRSPWPVTGLFALCTVPFVLFPQLHSSPDSTTFAVTPSRIQVTFSETTTFEWTDRNLRRSFGPSQVIGPPIPKPLTSSTGDTRRRWGVIGGQVSICLVLLHWLVFTSTRSLGVVLSITGLGIGLSTLLHRWGQLS